METTSQANPLPEIIHHHVRRKQGDKLRGVQQTLNSDLVKAKKNSYYVSINC